MAGWNHPYGYENEVAGHLRTTTSETEQRAIENGKNGDQFRYEGLFEKSKNVKILREARSNCYVRIMR